MYPHRGFLRRGLARALPRPVTSPVPHLTPGFCQGTDYILSLSLKRETHYHLVCGPSPASLPIMTTLVGGLAADCPLLYLQRFYHTRSDYLRPPLCYHSSLVVEALGSPRNLIMSPLCPERQGGTNRFPCFCVQIAQHTPSFVPASNNSHFLLVL
jgi:hypothetical protein